MIIGIDPGQRGAYAAITSSSVDAWTMPSLHELADRLSALKPRHVFLEKGQSMPKQGIASAFNYGHHCGELSGVLVALGIPHTLVRPATWAREMHQGTRLAPAKSRSLEAAQRLWPWLSFVPAGCKKPHDGIIDALLLAEFGRRSLGRST